MEEGLSQTLSILNQLGSFRSILCLNSDLINIQLLREINLPIIAVDGASKALHKLGAEPYLIIGDLDSDDPRIFPNVKRVHTPDQNYSDFEKAIAYLEYEELLPAIVLGVSGGNIDHILYNISVFCKTNCLFVNDSQIGFIINGHINLDLPINSKISLIGCPEAIVNSSGLKWDLFNDKLNIFGLNSLSNRSKESTITVEILEGKALLIIHTIEVMDGGSS